MNPELLVRGVLHLSDLARRGLAALYDIRGFDPATRAAFCEVARQRRLLLPPPSQSAAAQRGLATGLSETARRLRLKRTRSYNLGVTSVDCTALLERPQTLADKAPMLADLQLHLLARRAEIGHRMRADDAVILAIALAVNNRLSGEPAVYHELLLDQATGILGDLAFVIVRGDSFELSGKAATPWAAAVIEGLKGGDPAEKTALAPVDLALLGLMETSIGDRTQAMRALVERHLDPTHGMVLANDGSGPEPPRYYTRPLAWLAFLRLCELNHKVHRPFQASCAIRLPYVSANSDTPERVSSRAAANYLISLAEPPSLPATWKPAGRRDDFRIALEETLDAELTAAVAKAVGLSLKAEPLPSGACAVLSVRHDVDRPLSVHDMEPILAVESELGIRSSWFFKPETYDPGLARRLLAAGCEIGYHASHAASGDFGFAHQLLAEFGALVQGCTFHGGFGSTYWTGRDTLVQVARLGFNYSELPSEMFTQPYRWSHAEQALYLTPAAIAVQSYPQSADDHLAAILARRGHIIIEDHPDRFDDSLARRLADLASAGAIPRSVGEHVAICRATDAAIEGAVWRWEGGNTLSLELTSQECMVLAVWGTGPERVRCSSPSVRIGGGRGCGSEAAIEIPPGSQFRLIFHLSDTDARQGLWRKLSGRGSGHAT